MPLLTGQENEVRREVFAEGTYHAAYEPQRMVRTQRWKYVRRFEPRTRPVLPNTDDSPSKDVWLRYGWAEEMLAHEQLYDLIHDPNEACNLIGRPDPADVTGDLRDRLETVDAGHGRSAAAAGRFLRRREPSSTTPTSRAPEILSRSADILKSFY